MPPRTVGPKAAAEPTGTVTPDSAKRRPPPERPRESVSNSGGYHPPLANPFGGPDSATFNSSDLWAPATGADEGAERWLPHLPGDPPPSSLRPVQGIQPTNRYQPPPRLSESESVADLEDPDDEFFSAEARSIGPSRDSGREDRRPPPPAPKPPAPKPPAPKPPRPPAAPPPPPPPSAKPPPAASTERDDEGDEFDWSEFDEDEDRDAEPPEPGPRSSGDPGAKQDWSGWDRTDRSRETAAG
ncbi:hypothetical protein BKA01_008477 [Pseudonocardia eucalypti]|nr:hypothetical protein [Pseudonocardia eucalypti]